MVESDKEHTEVWKTTPGALTAQSDESLAATHMMLDNSKSDSFCNESDYGRLIFKSKI